MNGEIRSRLASGALVLVSGVVSAAAPAADDAGAPARRPLRVGAVTIAAIVEWQENRPVGPMVELWEELARRTGIETEFVKVDTVAALIETVEKGELDVALGPLAITEERERMLDLTHPVFHSGTRIAVRQKNDVGLLAAAASMLSWPLLALVGVVLALVLASGHLLWWCERGHNPGSFPAAYPRGVVEAVWWIASTIITGGCDDKHVDGPLGRVVAFAWMVGGIGLIAAFTSVLTATITAERVAGTIQGPRDLAGRLVAVQAMTVTRESVLRRGGIPQDYPTLREAVEALDAGAVRAVVGETVTLAYLVHEIGRGRLRVVGPTFDAFDYGIALPSGSPLREPINTALLRMREDGTIDRIAELAFGKHD